MKILVTGAAGAVGSHAAERFAELGHMVYGIDSFNEYYDPALKEKTARDLKAKQIEIICGNIAQDDLSRMVTRDTEVIFHFAAQPGISSTTPFEAYLENNVIATQRLLEAAQKLDHLKCFVFISTSSVYGSLAVGDEITVPTPSSVYGVTKLAAEQLALSYYRDRKLPVTALRLFSVYGERERPDKLYRKLIEAVLSEKPFPLYEGSREHIRSYTYVGDVVDAFARVVDRLDVCIGEIFNIGTDVTSTTGEGIDIVVDLLKEKGKQVMFEIKPPRSGDQLETGACIDKARKVLGYSPKTSLREGLVKEVEWILSCDS
jgi:UDP-glucuronate 4-epimerase